MSDKKPVVPALQLLTLRGVRMRSKLMIELGNLECPADEECAVSVTDSFVIPGIAVWVQRSTAITLDERWQIYSAPGEESPHVCIYRRVFESESEQEIARAIQDVLDVPGLAP